MKFHNQRITKRMCEVAAALTEPEMTAFQMAKGCTSSEPKIRRVLTRLALDGYVEITHKPHKGRTASMFTLTDLGRRMLAYFDVHDHETISQHLWRAQMNPVPRRAEVWPGVRYIIDTPRAGARA